MAIRKGVAIALLIIAESTAAAPPRIIELFCQQPPSGLDDPAVAGVSITIHRLDELPRLEARLSVELPNDPAAATAALTRRLTPELQRRLAEAWGAWIEAKRYGIDRLPTAVIDRDPTRSITGSVDLPTIIETASR